MTEKKLRNLGFKFVNQYKHDEFVTNKYVNGVITAEFTYLDKKLETLDFTIDEINGIELTDLEIKKLVSVLCKK